METITISQTKNTSLQAQLGVLYRCLKSLREEQVEFKLSACRSGEISTRIGTGCHHTWVVDSVVINIETFDSLSVDTVEVAARGASRTAIVNPVILYHRVGSKTVDIYAVGVDCSG